MKNFTNKDLRRLVSRIRNGQGEDRNQDLETLYKEMKSYFINGTVSHFSKYSDPRYLLSREEAFDLYHDAFLVLWDKIVRPSDFQLHKGVSLHTYLFSIGKNIWRNKVQTRTREELKQKRLEEEVNTDTGIFDPSNDAVLRVARKSLREMGTDCRSLIHGLLFEGFLPDELADAFGISYPAFRKRKQRCLGKLKSLVVAKLSMEVA